jgi:hypothetical protein
LSAQDEFDRTGIDPSKAIDVTNKWLVSTGANGVAILAWGKRLSTMEAKVLAAYLVLLSETPGEAPFGQVVEAIQNI